jgi:hypothetical protein
MNLKTATKSSQFCRGTWPKIRMTKLVMSVALLTSSSFAIGGSTSNGADNFYKSDKVTAQKVTFKNQYNMMVVGNLFVPKSLNQPAKNAAIVVGHPMGAVKEQSANLYAQKLADQGFVTLSLDLPFWGESEGQPRNAVLPDVYAEAFSAAVDFLGTRPFVDRARIGALGICGSGSFVISAAKIDPQTVAAFGRLDAAFDERHCGARRSKCMKYELLQMRQQDNGAIVNNPSIGGLIGIPGRAIYHATKHGVIGLTKSAALEYTARGIRINAICPGAVETPMVAAMIAKEPETMKDITKEQPIGRLGKPEEIASAVLWLCSPGAGFVIGHALAVDGGYTAR